MPGEADLIRGVQLVHVDTDGPEITADVYGGEEPVAMAEVDFRTLDSNEYRHLLRTFEKWEPEAAPLTLVQGADGVATLVDEEVALH